jgi:hypothetical protein
VLPTHTHISTDGGWGNAFSSAQRTKARQFASTACAPREGEEGKQARERSRHTCAQHPCVAEGALAVATLSATSSHFGASRRHLSGRERPRLVPLSLRWTDHTSQRDCTSVLLSLSLKRLNVHKLCGILELANIVSPSRTIILPLPGDCCCCSRFLCVSVLLPAM